MKNLEQDARKALTDFQALEDKTSQLRQMLTGFDAEVTELRNKLAKAREDHEQACVSAALGDCGPDTALRAEEAMAKAEKALYTAEIRARGAAERLTDLKCQLREIEKKTREALCAHWNAEADEHLRRAWEQAKGPLVEAMKCVMHLSANSPGSSSSPDRLLACWLEQVGAYDYVGGIEAGPTDLILTPSTHLTAHERTFGVDRNESKAAA